MKLEEVIGAIQEMLANGQIKQMDWIEMIRKLEEKGIGRDDIDDALNEAERRKIIRISNGFCKWIDPSLREEEKAKTERYFEILAEIFKEGEIEFLPREDVEAGLMKRELDEEEIARVFTEAARDHVLDRHSRGFGPDDNLVAGYSWIPPEERHREAEADKRYLKWLEKRRKKKAVQEGSWGY